MHRLKKNYFKRSKSCSAYKKTDLALLPVVNLIKAASFSDERHLIYFSRSLPVFLSASVAASGRMMASVTHLVVESTCLQTSSRLDFKLGLSLLTNNACQHLEM